MKKFSTRKSILAGVSALALVSTSCVDDVEFGNNFLEKASGGDFTADTVFNSITYVGQYLNTLYAMQYYGIPYRNYISGTSDPQESSDIYTGKVDMLTDLYVTTYGFGLTNSYLKGNHTSKYGDRGDKFHYLHNRVWTAVRYAYLLIERIDEVPGMSETLKKSYVAQAKAIIASRCFDIFKNYGAVPIVDHAFTGTESSFTMPRATLEDYVEYLVGLCDEAAKDLPWKVDEFEIGHWTKAGVMALKCKILAFAASPLFNDVEPYHPEASNNKSVWYGGYDQARWQRCRTACEEFFTALSANGYYQLVQAEDNANIGSIRPEDYRLAYRTAYAKPESPEILHCVMVIGSDAYKSGQYVWHQWMSPTSDSDNGGGNINRAYYPTQEYAEMFPWKDGKNFDWDEAAKNDEENPNADHTLQKMFGVMELSGKNPKHYNLTRDPRMYEEMWVNGLNYRLDWNTAEMTDYNVETWVGGTHATTSPELQAGRYATGYGLQKFVMGEDYKRLRPVWPTIRLSDMYLTYAEALAQTGDLSRACEQVNVVRARVGLPAIETSNPELNLTSDKEAFINELLRERACEFGLEDSRFYDLVRYKRKDIFEKPLHSLKIYWLKNGKVNQAAWYDGNKITRGAYPSTFKYVRAEWSNEMSAPRYWWTQGFDPKWYLSPIPVTEINKNYGLVQNPGW
ncbi:MAG: RagB/SusD family nutrient uptake outer membrane protein [Bacteroidales bacterium]|nr:RagB/SusD family nutrient uptake outer membrane protein [Bacteroidales bacterium]